MVDPAVHVRTESRESGALVALVTIDNGARLNCLNTGLMDEFARAMSDLSQQPMLRAVVLTGAGDKAFVGGADIDEMAALDAEGARFGMPEVRLGIPSVVEAALLPALVGWGRARQILLLGGAFSAATAAEWGLVEEVAPAHRVRPEGLLRVGNGPRRDWSRRWPSGRIGQTLRALGDRPVSRIHYLRNGF